ncbi:probable serine hydrolase isoform X1 [Drosophila sechellia]|uniref:GM14137 n=1 Tax=Drosophila sechellia TaxID=7238 RepID=B4HW51_DROSE|nr:probable serine hydrolase isoform X1 [Drosophila sechellia]EDW50166.1 GM14137 [Drosophila sechellia]
MLKQLPVTNKFLQCQELKIPAPWGYISGRWYGDRTERPILALHGFMDNLGSFDRLVPLLPDHVGVLCIDLPGHGRSSPLPLGIRYDVYNDVFIIPRIMKHFGWVKVSLMGHSLGAFYSFIYATMAPNTVDMVICIDCVLLPKFDSDVALESFRRNLEQHMVQDEILASGNLREPPSYKLPKLEMAVANGTLSSVTPDLAQHLLHRQVKESGLNPDSFYLSIDRRIKFYNYWDIGAELSADMARGVGKKPFLIIKGSMSPFLGPHTDEAVSILAQDNPHFEFYEVENGTHHVHLRFPEECAKYMCPFIQYHRPPSNATLFRGKL